MATLYTIGHSTRTLDELIAVLRGHSIETLVDIRSFPVSRRLPHFNRESLEQALPSAGIRYVWMKGLGGYRKKIRDDSPNLALRSASFRNYADHMLTPEFETAISELVHLAEAVAHGLHVRGAGLVSLPSHAGVGLAGGSWAHRAAH